MLPIPICISAPGAGNGLGGMPGMGMGTTLPLDLGSLNHSLAKGRNVHSPALCMWGIRPFENSIQLASYVDRLYLLIYLVTMGGKSYIHECGGAHIDVINLV